MTTNNMHGGTNKKIIDLFSQNMNTICTFRLKNPFTNYNGQQYTGTLFSIHNSIDRFDMMTNASVILHGVEYEGTIGLIRKYLHEANTIGDMIKAGMLTPSGPKFIGYNNLNVPLNQLFKNFGNEIILKFHAFRTSGISEHKIEIISYLNEFKSKLIMIPGDQYANLKLLCDNAISEISNTDVDSVNNYIGQIKNQFVNIFGPTVINPTMVLINNSIEHSLGNPPNINNILTATLIFNAANNRLRTYLRTPPPHNIPNNLNAAENIYMFYYSVVENILNITLDGFGRVVPPLLPPNNFEAAVVEGVDAILQSHGNNTINNIFPFDKHALSVLFGAAIPPAAAIPIPLIQNLFLHNVAYNFLGELCTNIPNPALIVNVDVLTRYIIDQFLSTPHGSQLILITTANARLIAAYGHINFTGAVPRQRYSYSHGPLIDIFDGINNINIPPANIDNEMFTLYAINIASILFKYVCEIENLLEIVNTDARAAAALGGAPQIHSYIDYVDLYGDNGADFAHAIAIIAPIAAAQAAAVLLGAPPAPVAIPPPPPLPLGTKDLLKNRIFNDITNEINMATLSAVLLAVNPAIHLRDALNKIFDIISIVKDENIHIPIIYEMQKLININNHMISNSNNLLEIGNFIYTTGQNITNVNNALTNAIIAPPTNINIYSKEIELLLIQLLVM